MGCTNTLQKNQNHPSIDIYDQIHKIKTQTHQQNIQSNIHNISNHQNQSSHHSYRQQPQQDYQQNAHTLSTIYKVNKNTQIDSQQYTLKSRLQKHKKRISRLPIQNKQLSQIQQRRSQYQNSNITAKITSTSYPHIKYSNPKCIDLQLNNAIMEDQNQNNPNYQTKQTNDKIKA